MRALGTRDRGIAIAAATIVPILPAAAFSGRSPAAFPLLYGAGPALPVLLVAGLVAFASPLAGAVFERLAHAERWGRRATGAVFIAVGIYDVIKYVFEVA